MPLFQTQNAKRQTAPEYLTMAEWLDYAGGYALGPCPEGETLGGHATVLLGVQGGNFIGENSWGRGWGMDEGYGTALKPAWEPFLVGRKP